MNIQTTENEENKELAQFNFSEEEQQAINEMQTIEHFKKGTILLKEGEVSSKCYYIIKGCIRKYYLKDGEEKTVFFYTENQPVSCSTDILQKTPSNYYLECVENTSCTYTTSQQEKELYKRFPRFETICRISTEEQLKEQQEMFANFMTSSPEERYLNLIKTKPNLLNRVPQYQLASYLGIKPESLSRIRKRLATKA